MEKKLWERENQIFDAMSNRDYERLKELLSSKNPIQKYYFTTSMFDLAVSQGDEVSLELLLNHGIIPNHNQRTHVWPESTFALAILSENCQIIRLLIDHGYDPDKELYDYWYKTVELNNVSIFQCLLESTGRTIGNDEWSQKMLFTACKVGSSTIVDYLLSQGVSIESVDENGWTCLFHAVANRHIFVIQLLVVRGANLEHKDSQGRSILYIPVHFYNNNSSSLTTPEEVAQSLVDLGAKIDTTNINDKCNRDTLIEACNLNSSKLVELLLDQGIFIDSTDHIGWTCLFHAVYNWDIPLIKLFIARGANLKLKDSIDRSILHIAVSCENIYSPFKDKSSVAEVFRLLFDNGAEINATELFDQTPIQLALIYSNINYHIIMELLRHPDIDLTKPDFNGTTVLHRMIISHFRNDYSVNILHQILSNYAVDINARDKFGKTPLEYINFGGSRILSLMLEFGADTKVLSNLRHDVIRDSDFISTVERFRLKRSVANFIDDPNIDILLARHTVLSEQEIADFKSMYSSEVERMKETQLCGKLTFYDLLHAKKFKCTSIAKRSGVREILNGRKHDFKHYANFLIDKYLYGLRPFTPIESDAMNSAEDNLNIIFNNQLPDLVVYNVKKYFEMDDMISLREHIKLIESHYNDKK